MELSTTRSRQATPGLKIPDVEAPADSNPLFQGNNNTVVPNNSLFPNNFDGTREVININGVPTVVPDVNFYQQKKTLAQGMMDLALLSANANQLRYVVESYQRHPYYYVSLLFISLSLIFQIAVGVGLILNSRYNVKDKKEICKANKINNFTIAGIFIVTVVNVIISAFGVASPPPDMMLSVAPPAPIPTSGVS